jgi:hyperosmotically inducible protein
MRRLLRVSLVVIAVSLFWAACATTRTTDTTTGEAKARMTDSELENNIKAKLNSDSQLRAADLSVSANAERNEATLSGTVGSQDLRSKALELAKSAQPGLLITDKIDVKPRELTREEYTAEHARGERERAKEYNEKLGDTLDDAWIHMKVVAQLIGSTTTPERKINVDVVNNVVTLRGTVETAEQKAEAERIAKGTEGVKRVVNQLKVGAAAK